MGITFVTPTNVTPGTTGSYQDVDNALVPDGASGVLVEFINTDTSNTDLTFGIRKNGSTDDFKQDVHEESHQWAIAGVDGSGIFEVYIESSVLQVYLIGYFDTDAVFFTNATDKTASITSATTWEDIDISGDTGADTAVAAFFCIQCGPNDYVMFRKNGSTDDYTGHITRRLGFDIVGVDGSEICEGWISVTPASQIKLLGYMTAGVTMHDNKISRTADITIGTYSDLTALPAGANGGIYHVYDSGDDANDEHYDFRRNGTSRTSQWCTQVTYALGVGECDSNRVVEGIITYAATSATVYETGYFTGDIRSLGRRVHVTHT